MQPPPTPSPCFPGLAGTQHGVPLLCSAEGLQGNYLLPAPPPSPLSYQLKHFRVQAKKPKSTLKKSLKGQNTNTSEGIWRGLEKRVGREECLVSSNRLEMTLVTLWAPRCVLENGHCFQQQTTEFSHIHQLGMDKSSTVSKKSKANSYAAIGT